MSRISEGNPIQGEPGSDHWPRVVPGGSRRVSKPCRNQSVLSSDLLTDGDRAAMK